MPLSASPWWWTAETQAGRQLDVADPDLLGADQAARDGRLAQHGSAGSLGQPFGGGDDAQIAHAGQGNTAGRSAFLS